MAGIDKEKSKDSLTELIFAITVLAFFFGLSNLIIYYGRFSFNIFDYIEISDIITSSVKYLVYITTVLIIIFFGAYRTYRFPAVNYKEKDKKPYKKYIVECIVIIAYVVCFVIAIVTHRFTYQTMILISSSFILLLLYIIYDFDGFLRTKFKYNIPAKVMIIISTTSLLWLGSAAAMSLKISSIIPKTDQGNSYIVVKNDTIKSTRAYYYIGRTKNFVFFYNETTGFTDIFPEKDISKISLK